MKICNGDSIQWYRDDEYHPCTMIHCLCVAKTGPGNAFCDECFTMWTENNCRIDFPLEEIVVWHLGI